MTDASTWAFDRATALNSSETEGDPTILLGRFVSNNTVVSYPPTLSASISPRYCWTSDSLNVSVRPGGGTVNNYSVQIVGVGNLKSGDGEMVFDIECGVAAGERSISVSTNHGVGPLSGLSFFVHRLPLPLSMRIDTAGLSCSTSSDKLSVPWQAANLRRITNPQGPTLVDAWINNAQDGDLTSPRSNVGCPTEGVGKNGSAIPLTGFILASDGRGATATTLSPPLVVNASQPADEPAGTMRLVWSRVPGASGYEVRYVDQHGGVSEAEYVAQPVSSGIKPAHLVPGLTVGKRYTFEVRARKHRVRTDWKTSPERTVHELVISTGETTSETVATSVVRPPQRRSATAAQAPTFQFDLRLDERIVSTDGEQFTQRLSALSPEGQSRFTHVFQNDSDPQTPLVILPGRTYRIRARLLVPEAPDADWVNSEKYAATFALSQSVTANSATLMWGAVAGATGYEVRLGDSGTVRAAQGTSHVFEELSPETDYTLYVRALYDGGASSAWSSATVRTQASSLPVPAGLSAPGGSSSSFVIRWTAVSGADGYDLRYRAGSEAWTERNDLKSAFALVRGLRGGTTYEFQVRARQGVVRSAWSPPLSKTTPGSALLAPDQPTGLSVSVTATGASASWDPTPRATAYEVKACAGATCQTETVATTAHAFSGLRPSTSYTFSVAAKNSGGASPAATVSKSTTALPVPSGLGAALVAAGLVSLEWTAVTEADGYDLRYRTGAGAWTERTGLTTDFELVTGLAAATRYEFQVRSRAGAARSAWSVSFYQTTPRATVQPPPEPTGLSVSLTATSASLSWDHTLRATSYEVQACADGDCLRETTTSTSAKLTSLTPSTSYTFSVVAKNSGGDSPAATLSKRTPAARTTLAVPAGLQLSEVGSSAARLSWERVSGVSGYEVKACADGACRQGAVSQGADSTLTHRFTSLTPAALYTFSVRAQAGAALSDWAELSGRTAASLRVRARRLADGRVELGLRLWNGVDIEPRNRFAALTALTDGGWRSSEVLTREIDGATYQLGQVSVRLDNRVCPAQVEVGFRPASGAARILPTQYRFAVTAPIDTWRVSSWFDLELGAASGAGDGAAADDGSLLDPGPAAAGAGVEGGLMAGDDPAVLGTSPTAGCAAAPSGLAASGVTQSGARLSWTAVTGASQYDVRVGGGPETELSETTTSYSFSGLAAGGTHTLEVRARSTGGASTWSSRAVTLPPPDPANVRAGSASETSLTLAWDGSAGATSYEVKRSGDATVASKTASDRSHAFNGLDAHTRYTLSVRALNAGGGSGWVSVDATTGRVAAPEWPPRAQLSVSLTARSASLSWPAAARATGYTVKACAGATCESATVTGASHQFSGLTPSTAYAFSVVAGNAGGESTALTAGGTTPAAPATLPAPTGLSLSDVGSSAARLSWSGVAGATGYEAKACVGESCQTQTVSGLSHRFTGLTPATLYTFSVQALAGARFSDATELSRRTAASLRVRARRLADGRVELGLRLWDGTDIEPRNRFAALTALTDGGWRSSETLTRAVEGTTYQLGRVSVRLDNRVCPAQVEVSFRPASGASRITPTQYRFAVTAPVDSWRVSSWFDLDLGTTSGSGDGAAEAEGALLDAGPAAAGAGVEGGLMTGDEPAVLGTSPEAGCAAAPSGLAASGVTQTGARLSWTAVTDATQYDVRVDGGTATELTGRATSHSFGGLRAGGAYSLEVRARSAGGASGWSSRSVTLPPPDPTNVRAGSASETGLTLSWDGSAGATSYEVMRSGSATVTTKAAGDRSHPFSGLEANTRYTLSVRALNAGGGSGWVSASGTTLQTPTRPTPLRLTASVSPSTCEAGKTAAVTWSVSGGTPPYTVTIDGASAGSSPYTVACQATAGSQSIAVSAADSGAPRQSAQRTLRLTVTEPPPPPTTSVRLTGRLAARLLNSGRVELCYQPQGGSRICPTSRFVRPTSVTPGRWVSSSVVSATVGGQTRQLGKITVTRASSSSGSYLDVCFRPESGTRSCPPQNNFYYGAVSVDRWLYTGWLTYTLSDAADGAAGSGDQPQDQLMESGPEPGETLGPGTEGGLMTEPLPPTPAEPDPAPEPPG